MSSLVLISNLFSFPSGPRKDFAVCMRKSINSKIFDHHLHHHQIPRLALKRYALFSQSTTFFAHFKTPSSLNPRSTFLHSLVREESRMAIKINGHVKGSVSVELENIIKSVASHYGDELDDVEPLHLVPLKGAMTNEVFQITWPTKRDDFPRKVLVRVYGEGVEVFFDRDNEIRTFEYISKHGQGPRLLGRFSQGRIEEFIHARTLSAADLRDSEISALIAAKLRDFHTIKMPFQKDVHLWKTIRKWLVTAKSLCSEKEVKEFGLETLDKEIAMLEKELPHESQEIGFCHNDLQYGNIMMDEETRAITLIDYEYASYNPIAYDIANHFCEMVADYHSDTPHLLDYTKYPDLEERRRFVVAYLSSSGKETCEDEAEELLNDAERYTLANHMFWGLWGIISDYVNNIDFDYMEYARQRFRQYRLRKMELLGCQE